MSNILWALTFAMLAVWALGGMANYSLDRDTSNDRIRPYPGDHPVGKYYDPITRQWYDSPPHTSQQGEQ